ncbi:unnamed protein product [Phytomonas sp. EM1]|nr:unnamed protein product [Phytomonas sp. EM1]|eukprot:CCW60067.1 unnamed protein product [Phytomonas sp. isolate EM1]
MIILSCFPCFSTNDYQLSVRKLYKYYKTINRKNRTDTTKLLVTHITERIKSS